MANSERDPYYFHAEKCVHEDKIENKISLNIHVQKKCARSLFTVTMVK